MEVSVGFDEKGKTGVHAEKPLGAKKRTNNKLKTKITPGLNPGHIDLVEGECYHHYVTLTPRVTRVKEEDRPCFTIEADTVERLLLLVLLATVVQRWVRLPTQ